MTATIEFHGPMFDGRAITKVVLGINEFEKTIAKAGVKRLQEMFRPAPEGVLKPISESDGTRGVGDGRGSTGEYAKTIHALVSNLLIEIEDNGAIYGPWLEGESSRNVVTRFKGYATFRKTKQWLEEEYIPGILPEWENKLISWLDNG